jgi:hypothetical protein
MKSGHAIHHRVAKRSRSRPNKLRISLGLALATLSATAPLPSRAHSNRSYTVNGVKIGPHGAYLVRPRLCDELLPAYRRLSPSTSMNRWTDGVEFKGYYAPHWVTAATDVAHRAAVAALAAERGHLREPGETPAISLIDAAEREYTELVQAGSIRVEETQAPTRAGFAVLYQVTRPGRTLGTKARPLPTSNNVEPLAVIVLVRLGSDVTP